MNYRLLLPFFAAILPICGYAQQPSFGELADSCFSCLTAGDTLNFNRLYPRIADAYDRENNSTAYALQHELTTMRDADQGIRILLLEARKRFGSNSPEARGIHDRMKQIDRLNALRAQQILDTNGWPAKDDIGEDAAETIFLCIQHVDDIQVQEKYLPMLEKAIRDGDAEGWHLAFLTDRIRMNRGEKQIYGTQTVSRDGKLDYVVPLENPDKVDSLRQCVGLEPMNAYLDGAWDLEAYKRDLPEIERKYKTFTASRKTAQ